MKERQLARAADEEQECCGPRGLDGNNLADVAELIAGVAWERREGFEGEASEFEDPEQLGDRDRSGARATCRRRQLNDGCPRCPWRRFGSREFNQMSC